MNTTVNTLPRGRKTRKPESVSDVGARTAGRPFCVPVRGQKSTPNWTTFVAQMGTEKSTQNRSTLVRWRTAGFGLGVASRWPEALPPRDAAQGGGLRPGMAFLCLGGRISSVCELGFRCCDEAAEIPTAPGPVRGLCRRRSSTPVVGARRKARRRVKVFEEKVVRLFREHFDAAALQRRSPGVQK